MHMESVSIELARFGACAEDFAAPLSLEDFVKSLTFVFC